MESYEEWAAKNTDLGGLLIRIKEITGEDIKDPDLIRGIEAAVKESGEKFFFFLKNVSDDPPPSTMGQYERKVGVKVPPLGGWRERGQGEAGPNGP